MTIRTMLAAMTLAIIATPLAAQQAPEEAVRGYRVNVRTRGVELNGELLAVDADSIWIFGDGTTLSAPLADVSRVRIRKHGLGPSQALIWSVVGGVVTGGALAAACSSVEGTEGCGGVFVAVALGWLIFGGLSAATLSEANVDLRGPIVPMELRRYARYPQGRPQIAITLTPGLGLGVTLRVPMARFR